MDSPVPVDPFRCRVWNMHDRLEEHITEENCAEEIRSFKEHGQLVKVIGRPVPDDPSHDVEIICGARRLFVARHLKVNLLVELRELSDKEAIVAMDLENRQRKDISPYERGLSYARWLRNGYFDSQDEIALALGVSASQVSRLLKLARLPSVIVAAFDAAVHIRENWGLQLSEIMEHPEQRKSVIQAAREIRETSPLPPPREVYRRLLAALPDGAKSKSARRDKVVRATDGTPLFRIRYQRRCVVVLLPIEKTSGKSLSAIEQALLGILQNTPGQSRHRLQVGVLPHELPAAQSA